MGLKDICKDLKRTFTANVLIAIAFVIVAMVCLR